MQNKTCRECLVEKCSATEFEKQRRVCRECRRAKFRKWYDDNKEYDAKRHAEWYKENKDRSRANNQRWLQSNKDWVSAKNSVRLARIRSSAIREKVSVLVLAERDNYLCGLCGDNVDMSLPARHPKSKTIDHVIPVSRGGDHSYANTQLAHFGCNSGKRDRV